MEPHFLPFEEAESGVSTEIRRFQNNITRISIAMRGINRFMKTLNDLFGWWDVGKTLVVVTIGLYIIWMVRDVRNEYLTQTKRILNSHSNIGTRELQFLHLSLASRLAHSVSTILTSKISRYTCL